MAKHPIINQDNLQQVSTTDVAQSPDAPTTEDLYPNQTDRAVPEGAKPEVDPRQVTTRDATLPREKTRTALEEEVEVWNGRYSFKNFIGRILLRGVLTIAWIALVIYTFGSEHGYERLPLITWLLGGLLLIYWLTLVWQMARARLGHYYKLTTKRLFVETGVFHRRRDQVEMLRVDDVYVKQPSIFHRTFDFGTVVVESSEEKLPVSYLTGIDDPHTVMDLVWHHARTERDLHSVKVDEL